MYRPFQVFLSKKFGKQSKEGQHEDAEAVNQWNSLSSKKQMKFLKKAERIYDEVETDKDKQPFHTYLTYTELELLMKSYNMPDRPPPNSKVYCIHKYQKSKSTESPDEDEEAKNRSDGNENWNNLPQDEKKKILDEYHKISDDYEFDYIDFLRSLPQQRVDDYKYFLSNRKNNHKTKHETIRVKKEPSKKVKKEKSLKYRDAFRGFVPHEIYYLKMKSDETDDDPSSTRVTSRSAYTSLSDKKKLKYIKKAEQNYDSYDFSDEEVKPRFSFFLSKQETELLLKSYGLPDIVPSTMSGFYLKKISISNPGVNMEKVFQLYREMNADEKERMVEEHKQARKDFESEIHEFLDRLPASRLDDYNYFRFKKSSKRGPNQNENGDESVDEERKKKKAKTS